MKIISNGKSVDLPSGGDSIKFMSKSDYRDLSREEKMADILYVVEDDGIIPANLDDADWEDISRWSKAGILKNHYKVGDAKRIMIGGNFNGVQVPITEIELVIAGFDHNAALESPGEHRTHFLLGRIDSKITYMAGVNMFDGASGSNAGGWKDSVARSRLQGPNTGLTNILPRDLQAVMRTVKKYTNNVAGGAGANAANITSTDDNIAVLSLYEMFGVTASIDPNEADFQTQYPLFSDVLADFSDKQFASIGENTQNFIWTRSACINNAENYACWVNGAQNTVSGIGYVSAAVPIVIFV